MDPKALSNMDPKLRETYERVMGTTVASTQTSPSATIPTPGQAVSSQIPNNITPPVAPPAAPLSTSPTPAAEIPQPQTLTPPFTPATPVTPFSPLPQNVSAGAFQPLPSPSSFPQNAQQQGSSPLLRILYIFGAVVFFGLYTIFWIKVFGFRLPF